MIYEIQTPDGRIIEVEGDEGKEKEAIAAVKNYLAKETTAQIFDEDNFDYETGVNAPGLRAQLDLAETQEEKELVLNQRVGSQGYIRDSANNFALTPLGLQRLGIKPKTNKNVIIDESGFSSGDFADFAGVVGPIAGAVASLSPHVKLLRLVSQVFKNPRLQRAAAVGLGSAAGAGVEEAGELAAGLQAQSAGEVAKDLAFEAAIGGLSQGLFEAGGAAVHAMLGRKANIVDVNIARAIAQGADPSELIGLGAKLGRTPTFKDVQDAQAKGIIETFTPAAVSQRALGREIPGRIQAAAETVFGRKERDEALVKYGNERLQDALKKLGAVDTEVESFASLTSAGRFTAREFDEYMKNLSQKSAIARTEVDNIIKNTIKGIDEGAFDGDITRSGVGQALRDQLKESYDKISNTFKIREQSIDKFLQNNGLDAIQGKIKLDMKQLRKELDDITKRYPTIDKTLADDVKAPPIAVLKKVIKEAQDKEGGISIEALNNTRSALLTLQRNIGLQGGKQSVFLKDAIESIDNIFNNLASGSGFASYLKSSLSGLSTAQKDLARENVKKAAKMIKNYNADYNAAIKPFNDVDVARVTHKARLGSKDIDEIYSVILKKDRPELLNRFLDAITDVESKTKFGMLRTGVKVNKPQREIIKEQLRNNVIREAVRKSVNVVDDTINPVTFAREINKLGSTSKVLFGDLPNFQKILDDFAKINTNFPTSKLQQIAENLNSKEFAQALKKFTDADNQRALAESDRFLRRVRDASPDEVVDTIFRNGQALNVARAKSILGKDSQAFQEVQQESMRSLLRLAVGPGKRVDEVFNPEALERALNAKGNDVLREMFDEKTVKGLRNLVQDLRVMTQGDKGGAGTLIAGAVAVNAFNLAYIPTLIQLGVVGSLLRNPATVRRLAKADKESVSIVLNATKDALRLFLPITIGNEIVETTRELSDLAVREFEKADEQFDITGTIGELGSELQTAQKQIPRLSAQLDLPSIQTVPRQAGAVASESLLGGSSLNEDIARSLDRIA
tara:strand:- start:252 stop:3314 length:3063 start_codon:yes stop_codon:yes gene_type:complete